jgi:hypothetical protein
VTFHLGNTGGGGVSAPSSILIDGNLFSVTGSGSPLSFTANGISFSGNDLSITLNSSGEWVFLSEVQFNTVSAVPEPETYAMFLAGLGLMGFIARRRKTS